MDKWGSLCNIFAPFKCQHFKSIRTLKSRSTNVANKNKILLSKSFICSWIHMLPLQNIIVSIEGKQITTWMVKGLKWFPKGTRDVLSRIRTSENVFQWDCINTVETVFDVCTENLSPDRRSMQTASSDTPPPLLFTLFWNLSSSTNGTTRVSGLNCKATRADGLNGNVQSYRIMSLCGYSVTSTQCLALSDKSDLGPGGPCRERSLCGVSPATESQPRRLVNLDT